MDSIKEFDEWMEKLIKKNGITNRSIFNGILIKLWNLEVGRTNRTFSREQSQTQCKNVQIMGEWIILILITIMLYKYFLDE